MRLNKRFLAVVFFISGFSGLAYQVIWTRMAFANFGIITPVLSVVLSVYMLGLAAGSWWGGRWIGGLVKRTGRSGLFFYGAAEGVIGLGAFAAPALMKAGAHALLSLGEMNSGEYLAASALALAAAILPWCLCMGATFPFMMAYVREWEGEEGSFSFLYTANVLGAMAGCFLTAVVLVEILGFAHSLWVAAGGNFLIAAASILSAGEPRSVAAEVKEAPVESPAKVAASRTPSRGIEWILFTTGFVSMAMEVVWTRAFCPVLKTQVYSFALIVFTYLGATFAGSRWYRRDWQRGTVISTGVLLAGLAVASFLPVALNDPRLAAPAMRYMALKSAGIVLASICPFCAILGYLTPSLVDEYGRGERARAGRAYGINVLGCILGPLAVSYGLLPEVRETDVLLILTAPILGVWGLNFAALPRGWRMASLGGVAAAAVWTLVFSRDFEGTLRRRWPTMEVRRDYAGTVTAFGTNHFSKNILVNGIGMTGLTPITKMMVDLPLALHRGPASKALVICFGMGTSYRTALSWGLETTTVELIPDVPKEFGYFQPDAAEVLKNPKGRIVIDDGRRFLERTKDVYDLILIDPPPPVEAAGSSLLYSKGFYDAAKPHLRSNGVLETWFPDGDPLTALAIYRSLQESFRHVRCFQGMSGWGLHYVASMEAMDSVTPEQMLARLPAAAKKDLLEWSPDGDPGRYIAPTLTHEYGLPDLAQSNPNIVITDDRPFNEYFLLRASHLIHY